MAGDCTNTGSLNRIWFSPSRQPVNQWSRISSRLLYRLVGYVTHTHTHTHYEHIYIYIYIYTHALACVILDVQSFFYWVMLLQSQMIRSNELAQCSRRKLLCHHASTFEHSRNSIIPRNILLWCDMISSYKWNEILNTKYVRMKRWDEKF